MLDVLLALVAGLLTVAAPCILLPLPIVLGSSVGRTSRTRPIFLALGFAATFAVLGLTLHVIVQRACLPPGSLRSVAAVLLGLFGLSMVWPTPFERLVGHLGKLTSWAGERARTAGSGNLGGLLVGVIIGLVWAPCAGPMLGTILTLVAQQAELARAGLLLAAYAVGAAIPIMLIAYGGQAVTARVRGFARYAGALQRAFGVILVAVAVAVYFQYDVHLQSKILDALPSLVPNL